LLLFSSGFGLALLKSSPQPVKLEDATIAPKALAIQPRLDADSVWRI
jgi:hypothetical protein